MPMFRYEAMSPSGDEEADFVEATDRQSALQSLKERKLFVTTLVESFNDSAQTDATAANLHCSEKTATMVIQNSTARQIPKLVPAFFGIGGVVCIVAAGLLASLTMNRISGAVNVEGTIVEIIRVSSTDGETLVPLIEYHITGQAFRFRGNVISPPLSVGSRLSILVRPDRAGEGIVDTFEEKWLPSLIVGTVGIAFLLVTKLVSRSHKRRSRPS